MDVLGAVARIVVVAVLLASAAAKLCSPTSVQEMLRDLGVPRPRAGWLAVSIAELVLAATVLLVADSTVAASVTAALGGVFGAAGLYALRSGRTIHCACFGTGTTRLGKPQLLAFPVWLIAASAIGVSPPSTWKASDMLAVTLLLVLIVHLTQIVRAMRSGREDRLAVAEVAPG